MKKQILTLFLLLSISFNVVHAYVIKLIDTKPCQVSEYVYEVNNSYEIEDDDICKIDHLFHIAFILPEICIPLSRQYVPQKPYSSIKIYEFSSYDNFLKPPISA